MYQLFNGANSEDYQVTISTKDEATQEVFGEVIYPDALEELEEEQPAEYEQFFNANFSYHMMNSSDKSVFF